MSLETPIVFVVFNRPETTKQVFEKIKLVQPRKLYLIADAPRDHNNDDKVRCKQTRAIVENIDWDCEVNKIYATSNLGCGLNISEGITKVFEKEEMAIILEDDCVPTNSFFSYCEELLIRYKDDTRIMHIGGTNWHPEIKPRNQESYFFSKDAHIWGWATWKRAWKLFDYEMKDYPLFVEKGYYKDIIPIKQEQKYFKTRWDSFYKTNYKTKSRSNWDYQWYYTVLKNNGLCIWPSSNLVSNIGDIGTHSNNSSQHLFFKNIDEKYRIIKHPKFILRSTYLDNYHFKKFNYKSMIKKIYSKFKKIKYALQSFI